MSRVNQEEILVICRMNFVSWIIINPEAAFTKCQCLVRNHDLPC